MEGVEGAAAPALTLDLPEPADVDARYVAELGPLQVGDWDSAAPGAYNRWDRTGALTLYMGGGLGLGAGCTGRPRGPMC